ncbi:MAG: SRPBCC family protein [Chloroflexota bacterium]
MARFAQSVVIRRPVGEVWAFLARLENETLWQQGLIEARMTSEGPMGLGSTGEEIRSWMGRRVATAWKVTAFEADRRFAFKVTKPMPFTAAYEFATVPEGTRVEMTAEPTGFSRVLWPLIANTARKQYETDFAKLKEVLEAQA